MKKNQIIPQIKILGIAAEGKCIARYEDRVIFIPGNQVAPGDVVDLKILHKKKKFFEAVPVYFYTQSELRTNPVCSHFGVCGGCKWQHIDYQTQLEYKTQQVKDNLERIAKVALPEFLPIIGSEHTYYYRNKLEFTFSNRRWFTQEEIQEADPTPQTENNPIKTHNALGFHIPGRFDKILDIRHCYLQEDPSNAIRLAVRKFAFENQLDFYDAKEQKGFLRNLVIRTSNTGNLMVILLFGQDHQDVIEKMMAHLKDNFPEISSLYYIINPKMNDTYQDLAPVLYHGEAFIESQMEGLRFRIGPKSFYQTNTEQAYNLYQVARQFADLQGHELVYDLYTGTGTIANFIARQAGQVIGIEYVEEAIEDARLNSTINQIYNTRFFAGDIKDLLKPDFVAQNGHPDIVITDPPRAGMHLEVIQSLIQLAPQRIVYVSCNPATQARDLALLDTLYRVEAVQPLDMFPQTHHVENVVKLEKRA
ncbi:MAG: 23S rRNA (uracil(1939)-C(5))-methyltransferase RlmD [Microscillaceae bacterium]|nr:23S rRNA (uracil(1939)-C(5))-methyltransferase RlmD [Microscillaceae bacterium]